MLCLSLVVVICCVCCVFRECVRGNLCHDGTMMGRPSPSRNGSSRLLGRSLVERGHGVFCVVGRKTDVGRPNWLLGRGKCSQSIEV